MFKLWCEWDIGHENLVFQTRGAAMKWLKENAIIQGMIGPGEDQFGSIEDMKADGLVGTLKQEVI